MKRRMSLMTGLNLHLFRHEGLSYIASIDISLNHIYIRWFDILRSFCPLVALPFVYPLHYCLFTFCATVCLPFALPSVYRLHYRLFTFCTTVLLFVYILYYCATFCLRCVLPCYFLFTFCTTVRRTTAVSGVRRITFRANTCRASVCRRSAGRPNECPSAVVRLSILYLGCDAHMTRSTFTTSGHAIPCLDGLDVLLLVESY